MLRLTIQPLPGAPFEHLADGDEVVLGRSSECDVRLPSRYVSRRHARILLTDEGPILEDLGSHNGTRVDREFVEGSRPLGPEATIQIGPFQIRVEEVSTPAALLSHSSPSLSSSASRPGC